MLVRADPWVSDMYYGITTLATDFTEADLNHWRVRLIKAILFFVPLANPDHERLYPRVKFWALELDEEGWPQREVGLDHLRRPLFRAPDDRNTGFWPDMALCQFGRGELEAITANVFEDLWSGAQDGS